jgi:biotin carboxylase
MKKLAVLGASYLQKPLVLKANALGIETHCFAWDNDKAICKEFADYFYPISIVEKDPILNKCREIGIDGITTIATDMCVPTIGYVSENLNLVGNSYQSAILSTNKAKMRSALIEEDVSCPKSICVSHFSEKQLKSLIFPVIVKPTDRSGSRGISKVNNSIELKRAINNGIKESFENKVVVEEFIDGKEISVESISWRGKHYILAITDKETTGSPHFVETEHHQPSILPLKILEKVKNETLKALTALGIEFGASHSEFKINENEEVFAIEIGARMGGDFIGSHLVELSTGYDYMKGVIDIALNQFKEPKITEKKFSGVYFLSQETKHLLPFFRRENSFDVMKDIFDDLKYVTNSNDRSGYLVYQGNHKIDLI